MTRPFLLSGRCRLRVLLGWSVLWVLFGVNQAQAQSQRRSGDFLAVAMPLATLGAEWYRGDREGAWQYTLALAAGTAGTEVLKHATGVERPDRTDRLSFPSGHAARAFSSATYVHRRHGLDAAWPVYVAALYVGHTRVAANRHRWADVAGAAAVSAAAAWWLVEPKAEPRVAIMPLFDRHYIGVQVAARW